MWQQLLQKLNAFSMGWGNYFALGTFLLYVFGYLSLRFHLSMLGIATDYNFISEHYLFAGARFLVFLVVSTIPVMILIVLIIMGCGGVLFGLVSRLPHRWTPSVKNHCVNFEKRFQERWNRPLPLALGGILWATLVIQIFMCKVFLLSSLPLATVLPNDPILSYILIDQERIWFYMLGISAATFMTIAIFFLLNKHSLQTLPEKFFRDLLGFLALIQFVMLPINHGILVADKLIPYVTETGSNLLQENEEAWFLWEGNNYTTFLINHKKTYHRRLVSVPRKDIVKLTVTHYDNLFQIVYGEKEK
jgi:hypothetical protein